ncbi:hypothetical protein THAOC_22943 [Thalassiosira oceanica]|uniref:Uncharacterized protein n=1 Tax=Thalassiosira oceanica TaxID=159749 RepID=K0RVP3_THAOC|nr:hypothetical protein THAOC_22943 [Thalassiosira oceanica]|eukprot:EJK57055.1 hypothetical protein THAOC_22943 [Thalassiosira oceanica]
MGPKLICSPLGGAWERNYALDILQLGHSGRHHTPGRKGNLAMVVVEEALVCGQKGDAIREGERATAIRHIAQFCLEECMLQDTENRPTVPDSAQFMFCFTVFGAKLAGISPPLGWNPYVAGVKAPTPSSFNPWGHGTACTCHACPETDQWGPQCGRLAEVIGEPGMVSPPQPVDELGSRDP